MSRTARGPATRRFALRALAVAIAATLVTVVATSAFAADPTTTNRCGGSLLKTKGSKTKLGYKFSCSEEISSFTIVAGRDIAEFRVDTDGYDPSGHLTGDDHFACQGDIPSAGFTCTGDGLAHHTQQGDFDADRSACGKSKADRMKVWVVVASKAGVGAGPFRLKPQNCTYPKKKKRASHKA